MHNKICLHILHTHTHTHTHTWGSDVTMLYMQDSGKGIPENMIDTIFDPFVQGDMSTTRYVDLCERIVMHTIALVATQRVCSQAAKCGLIHDTFARVGRVI
jgi:hypothetical protein